jgi:hypothetical protein
VQNKKDRFVLSQKKKTDLCGSLQLTIYTSASAGRQACPVAFAPYVVKDSVFRSEVHQNSKRGPDLLWRLKHPPFLIMISARITPTWRVTIEGKYHGIPLD